MSASGRELLVENPVDQGWWLAIDDEDGPLHVVAGPFDDEAAAALTALSHEEVPGLRSAFGRRRDDGSLVRSPSPQERAWVEHLGAQLDRLAEGWDEELPDALVTLVVEVAAALSEAGLPLDDQLTATGPACRTGGVCLTPDTGQSGVIVSWRPHDRMRVNPVHGTLAEELVQQAMSTALAAVLDALALPVEPFGDGTAHIVRLGDC